MATLEEILIEIKAETSQLKAEMQSASKVVGQATEKMDKAIGEFSKSSGKNTSFMQTAFATMTGFLGSQAVLGTIGLLKDAFSALGSQLIDAGKEAAAEEQAFTRLATSLRLSGNYSKEAASGLVDFANEMEGLAGVGADVIASNLSVLSSLTRLNSEGLKAAQKSAIDLSAAMGIDLDSATTMVAKAVNGQDQAFKKLGITMNLTGNSAQNLAQVTQVLNDRFGGSAASKMQTFSGAMFVLKDAFGDVFKEVAKSVTQNEVVIAIMSKMGEVFSKVSEYMKTNASVIRDGIGSALLYLIDVLEGTVTGLKYLFQIMNAGFQTALIPVRNAIDMFQLLYKAATGNFAGIGKEIDDLKSNYTRAFDAIGEVGSDNTVFDGIKSGLSEIKSAAQGAFDEMVGKPIEAVKSQEALGNAVVKTSTLTKQQEEVLKSFAEGLANQNQAVSNSFGFANQMMQESLAQRMAIVGEDYAAQIQAQTEFFALQQELRDAQYLSEQDALLQAKNNGLVTEQQYNDAKLALAQKYALDNAKQQTAITQFQAQQEKTRADNFKGTMGTIASLASSGNKELAAIGKAAAITQATIDGYAAVQKALASAPPPFNFGLAALVGAATAANVAKIAGVGLKNGIDSVPRSSGGGNSGDNFPAVLKPGERVVPTETNQDLTAFLANQSNASKVNINVTVMPNTGLNNDQIGNLIEQLNSYFSSGGFKLIGAV